MRLHRRRLGNPPEPRPGEDAPNRRTRLRTTLIRLDHHHLPAYGTPVAPTAREAHRGRRSGRGTAGGRSLGAYGVWLGRWHGSQAQPADAGNEKENPAPTRDHGGPASSRAAAYAAGSFKFQTTEGVLTG